MDYYYRVCRHSNSMDGALAPYQTDAPYGGDIATTPPHPKFLQNCCSKGNRALEPYTTNWPYNTVFPSTSQRHDDWQACTDPALYSERNLALAWRDSYNWGVVDTGPLASTQAYLQGVRAWNAVHPGEYARQHVRKAVRPPACAPDLFSS